MMIDLNNLDEEAFKNFYSHFDIQCPVTHRNCGGEVKAYCLDKFHQDYKLICLKCRKMWIEEGPDS